MNPRRAISILFPVASSIALSACAYASNAREILIKTSKVQQGVVLIEVELNGKPAELECFLSEATCKVPKQGRYLVDEIEPIDSVYQDCSNVELFEASPDGKRGQKLGTYCDLSGSMGLAELPDINPQPDPY